MQGSRMHGGQSSRQSSLRKGAGRDYRTAMQRDRMPFRAVSPYALDQPPVMS